MPLDNSEYGKMAYQGYFVHSKGRSLVNGDLLPEWDNLSDTIKAAWIAAAMAVSNYDRMAVGECHINEDPF